MSVEFGPSPRLRIYSSPALYGRLFANLLTRNAASDDDVCRLECEVQRLMGARHAIAMPMARTGIYLAVKYSIKPGQKVILSPYTIADVINMVICAGGRPVFADIDRESCNINVRAVLNLLDDETGAVLVTHFYGQMADIQPILAACKARNIPVIEDAAQACGARLNGRAAGTLAKAGVLSFGMYKNINSFFGGMIVTDSDELAAAIRTEIADWPLQSSVALAKKALSGLITDTITWPPVFKTLSFRLFRWAFLHDVSVINNLLKIDVDPKLKSALPESYRCRMLPAQARLILRQLPLLDQHTRARVDAARLYHAGLSDLKDLIIAPLRTDGTHIYAYYPIQHADRECLVAHAMKHGRDIAMSYHRNCASLPCFREYALPCPNAQATADSLVYLPTYPRYGKAEVGKTIAVIRSYFQK